MKKAILSASSVAIVAFSLSAMSLPSVVIADTVSTQTSGETDAGALINKKVVDGNGATVGTIDSVLVNASGKVDAVVLDVSSWLESKKLVSIAWTDLKVDSKGNIETSMTKDAAKQAADYKYKNDSYRGRVLTDNNEIYQPDKSAAASSDQTTMSTAAGKSSVKNADGSLNASEVIGLKVMNANNENVGKISEVLLGQGGKADGVIVDVGGILGMGTHPVRLGWKDIKLHVTNDDTFATTAMTKDQLKELPAVK